MSKPKKGQIEHKGYTGTYEYISDEGIYFGKIIGVKDLITFQSKQWVDIFNAFFEAVEDYIELKKEVCEHCKGSRAVKVGEHEYQQCSCVSNHS